MGAKCCKWLFNYGVSDQQEYHQISASEDTQGYDTFSSTSAVESISSEPQTSQQVSTCWI